jgi:hypothetical protein
VRGIKALPTLADLQARPRATPKPARAAKPGTRRKAKGPTARRRAAKRRAEGPRVAEVRAACVERDGRCRVRANTARPLGDVMDVEVLMHYCQGPSEWAHLEPRARTRGMAPERRHSTATSVMLCRWVHDRVDGRARPRITIEAMTDKGADGPLCFRWVG